MKRDRTKYNHELSQLYLDICNKYNHSKQMKWGELYKILEELTKDKQIEL
ncbi:Mobile element protein [Lactococcus cremoris]|nr:Mobile element protein [Lactococcus cremoris]